MKTNQGRDLITIARKCLLFFVENCMSAFGESILCLVPRAPVVLAVFKRVLCMFGLLFSLSVVSLASD